jgi:hypothetical protein
MWCSSISPDHNPSSSLIAAGDYTARRNFSNVRSARFHKSGKLTSEQVAHLNTLGLG